MVPRYDTHSACTPSLCPNAVLVNATGHLLSFMSTTQIGMRLRACSFAHGRAHIAGPRGLLRAMELTKVSVDPCEWILSLPFFGRLIKMINTSKRYQTVRIAPAFSDCNGGVVAKAMPCGGVHGKLNLSVDLAFCLPLPTLWGLRPPASSALPAAAYRLRYTDTALSCTVLGA
ncbi:hypothetical protein OH77DRAFT_1221341 [Trametes cingulata]|nr:hypothetical protein OH77DRAFT_1221341 [Trametes cingulata]